MHPNIHTYVCVCVLHAYIYIHYPFIGMCENRSGLCMRAPVCDGDGSAVCAHALVGSCHVRGFLDRRLGTDHRVGHAVRVRGHEGLCVRARARV
jgi:hypothetical protein